MNNYENIIRIGKDYSDEFIKEKIFDAVKELKKIAKLF